MIILYDPLLYTKEEEEFRAKVRENVKNDVVPFADDLDRGKVEIWDIIRKLAKRGYLGIVYPKTYRGLEKEFMYQTIASEEISAVSLAVDMSMMASSGGFGLPIFMLKRDLCEKYLVSVVKGEKIGAFAYTEPEAGSDLARMRTEAKEVGEDYVLNGEKRFIVNGSVADYIVVYAKNGAFVVETLWDGFEVVREFELMGLKGLHLGHMKFNDLRVPKENALFYIPSGKGQSSQSKGTSTMDLFATFLGPERALIAAEALGAARSAYELAVKYSTERVQFKRPIKDFEGISFKIAQMATNLEAMRLLTVKAIRMVDRGELRSAGKVAAMAKLFAAQKGFEICNDALQILGGIGYTKEYPVEKHLRDIRLLGIGGGTNEIMQYVIQRETYREFEESQKTL